MPLQLRALVVIMTLSVLVLFLARRVVGDTAIRPEDFRRRAALWIFVTLAAFLTRDYWLYSLLTVPMIVLAGNRDSNRLAVYVFLMFAIPLFGAAIPGMGLFGNTLLELSHTRWLAIALLLPAYLALRSQPGVPPFGSTAVDKFFLGYFALRLVLEGMETTVTNVLRIAVGIWLDSILPYYVASRALRDLRSCRDVLMSFVVATLVLSPVALAEYATHWLLYSGLDTWLGLPAYGWGRTLNRGDMLRAQATAMHPIVLGYIMMVALAFIAFLRSSISNAGWWWLGVATLGAALVAALSRGPWVGAVAMMLVIVATGPRPMLKLSRFFLVGLAALPAILLTPQGQQMIDYLPFVGTVEAQNVEFRQRLFQVSLGVIGDYPFFGMGRYVENSDLEQLRGSDGLIDIVNTYVGIALRAGLVGLTLFLASFILVGVGILRALHAQPDKHSELHLLGRCLLGALVGIMVTIATVSPILTVPIVYTLVIGFGVSYMRLVEVTRAAEVRTALAPGRPGTLVADRRASRLGGTQRKATH